jgi:DNA adenine methylase
MKAPFPYFGGKSQAAQVVLESLGEVTNYVEPFAGSLGVLLGRDKPFQVETVNDADGYIVNFWRACASAPELVANFANWPVTEIDLSARHAWLVARGERLRWSLEDPDFFDPKMAGYWLWGICAWIGDGWCRGAGPHRHDGASFSGNAGQGINRQIPHVGNAGRGINRQIPHVGNAGRGINRHQYILSLLLELQSRLRGTRIICGGWERVVTKSVTFGHGLTGVYLDPPYGEGKMEYSAGGNHSSIAKDVWNWAIEAGENPKMRIIVSAYEDGRAVPSGWSKKTFAARSGYSKNKSTAKREVLYCSPNCVISDPAQGDLL